jgi:DNA-binding CsgD family transcriptional regulator
MPEELVDSLRTLGLAEELTRLYVSLLEDSPVDAAELLARTGVDEAALDRLVQRSLALPSTIEGYLVPASPAIALEALAQERQRELDDARLAGLRSYDDLRQRAHAARSSGEIEVVTATEARARSQRFEAAATALVRRVDSPPHFTTGENAIELAHLERGVEYRVIYSRASLDLPGYVANNVTGCLAQGERARVLSSVPAKVSIVDDTSGVLRPISERTTKDGPAYLFRSGPLLDTLIESFDHAWEVARPLDIKAREEPGNLLPAERQILALLAVGASDDAIARSLDISRRTFFRHLERLMLRAHAETRFQLALHAVRSGWV